MERHRRPARSNGSSSAGTCCVRGPAVSRRHPGSGHWPPAVRSVSATPPPIVVAVFSPSSRLPTGGPWIGVSVGRRLASRNDVSESSVTITRHDGVALRHESCRFNTRPRLFFSSNQKPCPTQYVVFTSVSALSELAVPLLPEHRFEALGNSVAVDFCSDAPLVLIGWSPICRFQA